MYLTEQEAKDRLEDPRNLVSIVEHRRKSGGVAGATRLSPTAREIITAAAQFRPRKLLAKELGIHPDTIRHWQKGTTDHTSNGGRLKINADHQDGVDEVTKESQIRGQALDILVASLAGVSEKVGALKTMQQVKVADAMSRISERLNDDRPATNVVKVLVYAPRPATMKEYQTLEVAAVVE